MDVVVSDFDGVLFKRNHGLIREVVKYLDSVKLPIYIVTYRAPDQQEFILGQLQGVLPVSRIYFADSRKKDPQTKVRLVQSIMLTDHIVEAIDNDENVVVEYQKLGIPTTMVTKN